MTFKTILAILLILSSVYAKDYLQEKKTHVLDAKFHSQKDINKLSILFRTSIPLTTSGDFDYNHLFNVLYSTAIRERQIELSPQNSYMVIYNLIGDDEDAGMKEREYFSNHPNKGELRWIPMFGEASSPEVFTQSEIKIKSTDVSWMNDDIETVVDEINDLMQSTLSSIDNVIIVIHCRRGKDRTGQISGSYLLKYGKKTWEQVQALNWDVYGGRLVYVHQRALTWFCYHLKFGEQYSHLTCTHENLSPNLRKTPPLVGWNKPLFYQMDDLQFFLFASFLFASLSVNIYFFLKYYARSILSFVFLIIFRVVNCYQSRRKSSEL